MNNHESIADFCENLCGAEASSPFGPDSVVYKLGGKIFALLSLSIARLNLKCDPEYAVELREKYEAVEPGYHMSKKHWNSILWEKENIDDLILKQWINDSYSLIYKSLPKKIRSEIDDLCK